MATTAVIIQARMGSSRLPGKVLMDINGQTVLAHVLERCRDIDGADVVCCAIPESSDSDPVAAEAERCGAVVFRGSEDDVLDRYVQAARMVAADVVMRVTSDCPLIAPDVCADVLRLRVRQNADYAANNTPPSWPHGLDCEATSIAWLERAGKEAQKPMDREHVTTYIRRHPEARKVNLDGPGGAALDHRWTLDFPEDLDFMRALFAAFPGDQQVPGVDQTLALLDTHREIFVLNQMHHDRHHDPDATPPHDAKRYAGSGEAP